MRIIIMIFVGDEWNILGWGPTVGERERKRESNETGFRIFAVLMKSFKLLLLYYMIPQLYAN